MAQIFYIGRMVDGNGACISKVAFEAISREEFVEAQKAGLTKVIAFNGKYIRVFGKYSISDFEFVSYSLASMLIGKDGIDDSFGRGEVVAITVSDT